MDCSERRESYGTIAFCERELGHQGSHFGYLPDNPTRHMTWGNRPESGCTITSAKIAYNCKLCGVPSEKVSDHFGPRTFPKEILEQDFCFTCMYWLHSAEEYEAHPETYFVADWKKYSFPENPQPGSPAVFGPFRNRTTGTIIRRQQLWCQGTIPVEFRGMFENEYTYNG